MNKKTKQAVLLSGVGSLVLLQMYKPTFLKDLANNAQRLVMGSRNKDLKYGLDGKGWGDFVSSVDGWIPNAKGRNKPRARAAFLKEALPDSVSYEDYLKFANGAPYGGGYTEQDRMLLGDTFS